MCPSNCCVRLFRCCGHPRIHVLFIDNAIATSGADTTWRIKRKMFRTTVRWEGYHVQHIILNMVKGIASTTFFFGKQHYHSIWMAPTCCHLAPSTSLVLQIYPLPYAVIWTPPQKLGYKIDTILNAFFLRARIGWEQLNLRAAWYLECLLQLLHWQLSCWRFCPISPKSRSFKIERAQSKAKQSASRWMIENRTTSLPPRVQDFDRLLSLLSCVASDRRTLHTRDFTQMVTHLTIWCRGVCDPFLALIGVFAVCFSNCINWMMPLIPSTIFTNELPRRLGQKHIRNLKLHQQE